jgi:hypothetical protein
MGSTAWVPLGLVSGQLVPGRKRAGNRPHLLPGPC